MSSKKYKLLILGIFSLISLGSFAQQGGTYDIYDSSVISPKSMAQQNEFWNNTYDFPAKPRNMLEFGVSGGAFTVAGDVRAKFPTIGFGAHFRKALGYLFSLRLQFIHGVGKGLNYTASGQHQNNPIWDAYGTSPVFYNYKAKVNDISLQGIFTLNNIRFHKQKNGFLIYAGAGVGGTWY